MRRNAERDARSSALAAELGWTVVRVWEHEVSVSSTAAAAAVLACSVAPGALTPPAGPQQEACLEAEELAKVDGVVLSRGKDVDAPLA